MTHGSKCRSIHGHRGTIEVTCVGASLQSSGEQSDMIIDFGFLKQVMMDIVDRSIDHGFVVSVNDNELLNSLIPERLNVVQPMPYIRECVQKHGYWLSTEEQVTQLSTLLGTKLYVLPHSPTSERLAEHFFGRLVLPIRERSDGTARIANLRFWETPNCYADFPGLVSNGD
jgi:6-pyruvoyltetrahydropterin/6-carboxytetrahydropterin synthase